MLNKINNLSLPATILISSLVLGGIYYAAEVNKQRSIERQQEIKIQAEADKASASEEFANNLKCQTLLKDLKQRWNNVVGIYYSNWQNTCIVKYTRDGETEEAPVEDMQDSD